MQSRVRGEDLSVGVVTRLQIALDPKQGMFQTVDFNKMTSMRQMSVQGR